MHVDEIGGDARIEGAERRVAREKLAAARKAPVVAQRARGVGFETGAFAAVIQVKGRRGISHNRAIAVFDTSGAARQAGGTFRVRLLLVREEFVRENAPVVAELF